MQQMATAFSGRDFARSWIASVLGGKIQSQPHAEWGSCGNLWKHFGVFPAPGHSTYRMSRPRKLRIPTRPSEMSVFPFHRSMNILVGIRPLDSPNPCARPRKPGIPTWPSPMAVFSSPGRQSTPSTPSSTGSWAAVGGDRAEFHSMGPRAAKATRNTWRGPRTLKVRWPHPEIQGGFPPGRLPFQVGRHPNPNFRKFGVVSGPRTRQIGSPDPKTRDSDPAV